MRTILQRLRQHGLLLNLSKCVFGQSAVDFLGHRAPEQGAEPLTKHLEAVQVFPQPRDTKDLQSFLGIVNFYRRFIPAAAKILHPLTSALRGGGKTKLEWSPQMQAAFEAAKEAVYRATRLTHPDPDALISLACDASDAHVGAVLQQLTPKGWQPLSFYSKKLDDPQKRY
jgi:hypothetical protein